MSEIVFEAFGKQWDVLQSDKRIRGAFAGKRGGKTEVGAADSGIKQEQKPNLHLRGRDPYLGIIAAPTRDMLDRLSWKKFMQYWHGFTVHDIKSPHTIWWHDHVQNEDESMIYGISADNPARLEGLKAAWIWVDEIFQVKEQFFLECLARTSDMCGTILCTGSLGVQFINPKMHWAYKWFKENADTDTECFEWRTSDNPYFALKEIERMKAVLDEQTFRAMFEICWDITSKTAVYSDWSDLNEITGYKFNPNLETFICVDWGWAHPCAVGFYQYDKYNDYVYKFDEIVESQLTLENLYTKIINKPFIKTVQDQVTVRGPDGGFTIRHFLRPINISKWICDIAGDQHKEQTGLSNVKFFKQNFKVDFYRRKSSIISGICLVRSYIKTSIGIRKFFVDKEKCPKFIDAVRRYRYAEKDGIIINENPIKESDDEVDETRYFFINILDNITSNRTAKVSSFI